jgi:MFS family permease
VIQGIGVGGEWGGSVLLAMEWGPARRRGLMTSWPQLGTPIGLLLSTGMVTLLSSTTGASFPTWGWRIPFLTSALLVALGLYVRLTVPETPEFTQLKHETRVVRQPVWEAIRTQTFTRCTERSRVRGSGNGR